MTIDDLRRQRFTQNDVLLVTQLRKELLQTWVNRKVIELGEQNPGSGRRRLYSAIDVVKLSLMRRIADLGLDLSIGRDLADEAERVLLSGRDVDWEHHLTIRKREASHQPVRIETVASAGFSPLSIKYGGIIGDARHMLVSEFTEPFELVFSRRTREFLSEDRSIDPARRAALARAGVHAEPALIFPFGEIVNGTLLQVEALIQGHLPSVFDAMVEIAAGPKAADIDGQEAEHG